MDDRVKKVSKKKIVFVQIDEEITDIFERVKAFPYKEIYFVVPKRSMLLQSIVNIKILKQKLAEIGKEMALITEDMNGMKLAHQAEVRVYDHWNLSEEISTEKASKKESESALLRPVQASSNELEDANPSRLPQKKSSIFEVVREIRGRESGFSLANYMKDRSRNRKEKIPFRIVLPQGAKRLISGLVLLSVVGFFFIAYIALPGATISIEPATQVVTQAINITLSPNPDGPHEIKAYPVSVTVELSESYNASGAESLGANASGELTIFNSSDQEWALIGGTRFQTDEGIVFRIQSAVTVPAAQDGVPGKTVARVVADPLDANFLPVGERGNIEASTFFLPGLREESQAELYAESYEAMSGGTADIRLFVVEDDLVAAQGKLETALKEKAISALRKEVLAMSGEEALSLSLLEDSDVIQFASPLIDLPYEIIGQDMETFEVSGSLKISGVAYDSEALLKILKNEIVNAVTPGKQLVRIDEDTVSIDVFNVNFGSKLYEFTAQIQGIEEYEIDPDLEGGAQVGQKIREHIAGKSIEEAERYIQNLPEVNSVEIKIWPVWSPNIPSLPENIRIKSTSKADVIELEEEETSL